MSMSLCVYVRERERERERVYVFVCVCVGQTDRQSRSAGVAPEMNLINPLHAGITHITLITHKREILLETQVRRHQKSVQNRVISGPTKRTDVLQFFCLVLCSYWTDSMKCCVIECK